MTDNGSTDLGLQPSLEELKQKSLRGGAIMLATEGVRAVLVVVYLAVIARLLTPTDFGLVAMATAVLWLLAPLATMSMGAAAVQTRELSDEKLTTLFWWTLAIGVALGAVILLAAPLVGLVYKRQEVVAITRALAPVLPFTALVAAPRAVLQRRLRFGAVSAVEFSALVVAAVAAIAAAAMGLRYWSLVIHELLLFATVMVGTWILCDWRPGAPRSLVSIRPLLSYGSHLTAFRLLQSLRLQSDRFLVGRFVSPAALGAYSTAASLLMRIMWRITGPLSRVAVSSLARLQDSPEEFRQHYRMSILWTMSLVLPIVGFVALESELVVLGLLGPQWIEAVPIFRILAIGAIAVVLRPSTSWIFESIGRTDRQLRWGAIEAVVYLIAFIVAIRWGVLGIAVANAAISHLSLLPRTVYCFRHSPVVLGDLAAGVWRPSLATLLAGLTWWFLLPMPAVFSRPVFQLAVSALAFLALSCLLWILLPGGRHDALDAAHTTFGTRRSK